MTIPSARSAAGGPRASRLQRDTAARIRSLLLRRELPAGSHLPEIELARELNVSRTPVRAALLLLADQGLLEFRPGKGFFLTRAVLESDQAQPKAEHDAAEALAVAIARDRMQGNLADECSEADLMRRYGVRRTLLTHVLRQFAEAGVISRMPGHGWAFLPSLTDEGGANDAYRFRMIIEPAGLLEPGFALDPDWLRSIRLRHQRVLDQRGERFSSVAFFEMNAEFHEGLARASGNAFLYAAVVQQTKLRRFVNYDWTYGPDRVEVSVREHLAILDALESGARDWAASLLRRHIELASL